MIKLNGMVVVVGVVMIVRHIFDDVQMCVYANVQIIFLCADA